ncbi:MAG: hypothetical protein HON23_02685 [Rickettsiales bacterium]|jgi:hypothetical protein|nr:hypothetical protein [Rickettsiales bacterium]
MKDKSLTTLKFTVIILNVILILGFLVFVVLSAKLIKQSKCKNFSYVADDPSNVKISFAGKRMFVIEKYGEEIYSTVLDNCSGELINKIKVTGHE